ncbi:MAG TPA: aspartyl protease family protein [Candidatus Acidoferrales bacterium]|nr:aspartyl protease family protein [Candidatus Acidoferrales bacterium]
MRGFRVTARFFLLSAACAGAVGAQQSSSSDGSKAVQINCATPLSPSPENSERFIEARDAYRSGDFVKAVALDKAIIADKKDAALAYAGLVSVYLAERRTPDAYAAADKAGALASGTVPVNVAVGEAYFRQGKLGEAERSFLSACRASARALLGLSNIYRATSNYLRSREAIESAYAIDSEDTDVRRAWMLTRARDVRLKSLKEYLSRATDDDAETRSSLQNELAMMEDVARRGRPACRLASRDSSAQTKLEPIAPDDPRLVTGYGLPITLNGAKARLLLDTGASGILIDKRFADKAGIQPVASDQIKGIGDRGPAGGYFGYVDAIKIGDLEFKSCYVEVQARDYPRMGDEGLIGADVFEDFLVDVNMPDAKLKLTPLPARPDQKSAEQGLEAGDTDSTFDHNRYIAPEMAKYSQFFRFGHQILLPTQVNTLPYKLFLVDTGAFDDTISPEAAREVTKVSGDDSIRVKGLNGEVKKVYSANELTLTFAGMRQQRNDTVTFDLTGISDATSSEVSGILGFGMLRMLDMKIDYRDGLIQFQYDANRYH